MKALTTLLLSLVLGVTACAETPVQPTITDPEAFAFESPVRFVCGAWDPKEPTVTLGLFDVAWGGLPTERPSPELLAAVEGAEGTLVYAFHFDQVRVIISPERVPQLGASGVVGVLDPANVDIRVFVGFEGLTESSAVTAVGGTVAHVFTHIPALVALVPDDRVPDLRRDPRVSYVERDGFGCFQ